VFLFGAALFIVLISLCVVMAGTAVPVNKGPLNWRDEQSPEWPWLVGGTVFLVGVSACLLALQEATAGRFPIPVYQAMLGWFFSYGFMAVLPLGFWATLGFLWHSKWFGPLVLGATLAVGILDAAWLAEHLAEGYRYHGTLGVAALGIANVIGIGTATVSCGIGLVRRSKRAIAFAYLALFALLATVAFPVFDSWESI